MHLHQKKCAPCETGTSPLKTEEIENLKKQIGSHWKIIDEHHLYHEYHFANFHDALEFVNRIAFLSDSEKHHPDIELGWGYVHLTIYTHQVDGLTENDFILASKIGKLNGFQG